ncbi:FYVE [Durusdinium trenchii]|uniref:RhoGEF and PH domain-containing protein 3 n=1 Tax=Durusdinium trenchii TaxID=1381693 RepID=A0ABP0JBB8_9DINO
MANAEWSDDIEALEKVLEIYKALGAEKEERLLDLVTPFRRFVRQEDVMVRVAPFSANRLKQCKLLLFKDLILIAEEKEKKSALATTAAGVGGWLNSLARSRSSTRLSATSSSERSFSTSNESSPVYLKLQHRLDLDKCSIKSISGAKGTGFQLTHVYRERDSNDKPVTRIDMVEVWSIPGTAGSAEQVEDLFDRISMEIDRILEEDLQNFNRNNVDTHSEDGDGEDVGLVKKRSWAKSKGTLRKYKSRTGSRGTAASMHSNRDRSETGSTDGTSVASEFESVSGLSLKDLEQRYKLDFMGGDNEAEFSVVFGEGPMGFSLSSSEASGVIIGRVAEGSMAENGNVEIGDRLTRIAQEPVALTTNWRDAVEMIKARPRPVELTFTRNFQVNQQVQLAENSTKGAGRSGRAGRTPGKRSWARNRQRNRSFGAKIISLAELEKKYQDQKDRTSADERPKVGELFEHLCESESEHERACAATLQEIFLTEQTYLRDLRMIVGDYLLPIRRAVRRVRCKDISSGSTFCEHHQPRSLCSKQSKDSRPILEPEEIRKIFLNVEVLIDINTELLRVLTTSIEELIENKRSKRNISIGDMVHIFGTAFVKIMPFFRLYAQYCHHYTQAIDRLLIARTKNKDLDDTIKIREVKSTSSLQHLLIKPVQRICKYPLLFRSLLKAVTLYVHDQLANGADVDELQRLVDDLEKAMTVVDKIAKSVNEKVGEQENLERMMEVYAELGGEEAVPDLVEPSRRYMDRFDTLTKLPPFDDTSSLHHEMLYIFNDHLVFTRHAPGGYGTLRRTGPLRKLTRNASTMNLSRSSGGRGSTGRGSTGRGSAGRRSVERTSAESGGLARATSKFNLFRRNTNGSTGAKSKKRDSGSSSGASSRTSRTSSHGNTSLSRGSDKMKSKAGAVTNRVDLRKASVSPIEEPDETKCYGFILSFVNRFREEQDADEKPVSGDGKKRTAKLHTAINKVQVWLATEEQRNQVVRLLSAQIDTLQRLEEETKEASRTVGAKVAVRSWKSKHRGRAGTGTSRYGRGGDDFTQAA